MTKDTTASASVIICVYTEKRWGDILDAVASVQQQSTPPREILIVVDHNPSMLERVRAEIPGVIAVENSETQGLSGARNSGLAVAQGELIAFLDDDATAEPDWLERLSRCCQDPRVMGAGGTVEPEWLSKQPRWFPEEFYWVLGCTYQQRPEEPIVVRNPFGGCTCYKRELFEAVGGFRSGIGRVGTRPMGGEETELCIRGHQHWPERFFLYDPQARIHHRIPAIRANWRYFRSRCYAEGLSKATIAEYVGAKDGLSSERSYIISSLAGGIRRGLKDALFHRDVTGLQRAVAIVAGLMITVAGYLVGAINLRLLRPAASSGTQEPVRLSLTATIQQEEEVDISPTRILEVEIGQPLFSVSPTDENKGQIYRRALCLVRLHNRPLGKLHLDLSHGTIEPDELAGQIWHALDTEINEHLQRDGLPPVRLLDAEGLLGPSLPRCIEERVRFLIDAPFVSVIVPTHERPESIPGCLRALLALNYPHFEIIVVDNAPRTSATFDFIEAMYSNCAQVRYVREDGSGVSLARNAGIKVAKGEFLAFTDDDVIVDRNWLVELIKAFNQAEDVGCVTGLALPAELETRAQLLFEAHGEKSGYSGDWCFVHRVFMEKNRHVHLYRVAIMGSGLSMAFRADVLRRIGGFDPALGTKGLVEAGEDAAAFFQVLMQGYKVIYEPASLVLHQHRAEDAALRNQIYNYSVGATAYLTKNLLEHPELLIDLLTKVPYDLVSIRFVRSLKSQHEPIIYPEELSRAVHKGMLHGPFLYLWSRWVTRGQRKTLPSVSEADVTPLIKKES